MRIYTRTGDDGRTNVIGGRIDKDDPRVEAIGTVDELNGWVGVAAATAAQHPALLDVAGDLVGIQHELFDCGAELASANAADTGGPAYVSPDMTVRLERMIDRYEAELAPVRRFVLPGGTPAACWLHVCRTVCRRAERRAVALAKTAALSPELVRYLNRLSDLFFVMARVANARTGVPDVEYRGRSEKKDGR